MPKVYRYLFFYLLVFFASCTSQKNVIYFQGATPQLQQDPNSKLRIYPGDILAINVFTINAEAYPYLSSGMDKSISDNRSSYEKGFVVNENGELKLPLIGAAHLTGLTIAEAISLLEEKFKVYIDDPIITLKKLNFKVTKVLRPSGFLVFYAKYPRRIFR